MSIFRQYSYLMSAVFGNKSSQSKKVAQKFELLLNLVLGIVCFGYLTSGFLLIMPATYAIAMSITFLVSALVFELIDLQDTLDKGSGADAPKSVPFFAERPNLSRFVAMTSSFFGGLQYLIRNYKVVANFTTINVGQALLRYFYGSTAKANFVAMAGGTIAFISHYIQAYINWDTLIGHSDEDVQGINRWTKTAGLFWRAALCIAVYMFFPLMTLIKMFVFGGLAYLASTQMPQFSMPSIQNLWPYISSIMRLSIAFSALVVAASYSTALMYGALLLFAIHPKSTWKLFSPNTQTYLNDAWWMLPMGASLYGMMDIMNVYATTMSLGWNASYAQSIAIGFGMLSIFNISLIWGEVVMRYAAKTNSKQESLFKTLYSSNPLTRRYTLVLRECILCVIDILNNRTVISGINQILQASFGIHLSLFMLNICTVLFVANRLVIQHFKAVEPSVKVDPSTIAREQRIPAKTEEQIAKQQEEKSQIRANQHSTIVN